MSHVPDSALMKIDHDVMDLEPGTDCRNHGSRSLNAIRSGSPPRILWATGRSFFFHANVAKQPGSELIMRSLNFNYYEPRM